MRPAGAARLILALAWAPALGAAPQQAAKEYDLAWRHPYEQVWAFNTNLPINNHAFFNIYGPTSNIPRDEWSQSVNLLNKALSSKDLGLLEKSVQSVAKDNSSRAISILIKSLRVARPFQYWIIIAGLSQINSDEALSSLTDEIIKCKHSDIRRDLIMSIRLNTSTQSTKFLIRIIREATPDIQVSAIEECVDRERVAVVPTLIDIAEKDPNEERELTRRITKAIISLTKNRPPGGPLSWKAWWHNLEDGQKKENPEPPKRPVGNTVAESLRQSRITDYEDLKRGDKSDLIVVEGEYDSVQDVLYKLLIPHEILSVNRLDKLSDASFSKCSAIVINCGSGGGDWPSSTIERIRKYVESGGYVCATDLGMTHVIRRAFPGYIDSGKGTLPQLSVDIIPWRGTTGHPFLRGVYVPIIESNGNNVDSTLMRRMTWEIDDSSTSISFDPNRVIPLIEAPELAVRNKPTAVAATFAYGCDAKIWQDSISKGGVYEELRQLGGGKVLCVLSHFSKQRQDEDCYTLQNMLINFLIEAKDRKMMGSSGNVVDEGLIGK